MEVIPQRYIDFCEKVAELAREAELSWFNITVQPGFADHDWRDQIRMSWEQGRHGADNHQMTIESTVVIRHKAVRK